MSIASEISRLQTAKANLKTAIEGKGITVPSETKLDGYSTLVNSIPSGGSSEEDYVNPMGTKYSELPDLSKLDRTSQVLYLVVDTSRAETETYGSFGMRPQQAGTIERGHLHNGAFVVDETFTNTASQYWSDTLNKNGERFWVYRFTSESNIVRIDIYTPPMSNILGFTPLVAAYGNLPYFTTATVLASMENLILIDIKNCACLPNGSKVYKLILDNSTFGMPTNGFYNNQRITEIDMSTWNINSSTSLGGLLQATTRLRKVKFGTHNFTALTNITNMFSGAISLNHIDISGLNFSNVTTTTNAFGSSLMPNITDIDGWTAIPVSYNLSFWKFLTHDSLMKVVNSLPTVQTEQTLTLGTENLARLSSEEIAIATAKGWAVA